MISTTVFLLSIIALIADKKLDLMALILRRNPKVLFRKNLSGVE